MNNDECESVTEAKGGSSKIKAATVLEAMAKYNARKLEEKVKEESELKKRNANNQAFSKPGRLTPVKRKHDEPTFSEKLVGITQYVQNSPGFSGILKQRYSDFQVNEIDMEGSIVHLTDQTIPVVSKEGEEDVQLSKSVLTDENWAAVDQVMKTEGESVEIDVTSKSKEERLAIHKALRSNYKNIVSNTETRDGKAIMVISKHSSEKRNERWTGPSHTKFVLYKENMTTVEAINDLARRLRIKSSTFQYAGTKDKRAITSQLVTASRTLPERILSVNSNRYACGNFSFASQPLRLGDLKGNRFRIVLRNVEGDDQLVTSNLKSLEETGFLNYYGAQRFGTRHVPTHIIGKELIRGHWKEAIDLILKAPDEVINHREADLVEALKEWESSRDPSKAHQKLRWNKHTIEGQLLFNMKKLGKNDLVGALDTIPRNLRLTYLHAYQSYVWNTMASKRVELFGLKPVVGDLVNEQPEEVVDEDTDMVDLPNETTEANESKADSDQKKKAKPVVLDETNIDNYSIYDVVLPLPGYDVIYPTNELAQCYTDLLETDGMADGFKQSLKAYNLAGTYRRLLCKPTDLQWKCVRYNDPTLSLVTSDWDRLQGIEPHPGIEDGVYRALIVEFTLPPAAYATMALREATKMDMSPQFQSTLNEAGSNKQETGSKRIKSRD